MANHMALRMSQLHYRHCLHEQMYIRGDDAQPLIIFRRKPLIKLRRIAPARACARVRVRVRVYALPSPPYSASTLGNIVTDLRWFIAGKLRGNSFFRRLKIPPRYRRILACILTWYLFSRSRLDSRFVLSYVRHFVSAANKSAASRVIP